MKRIPLAFLRARLIALYLLSLAAVGGSILAWQADRTLAPLSLLWPPGLAAAVVGGAALHDRFSGLLDRHARARIRGVVGLAYGALLLVVSLGLLAGSRDAALGGTAILRALQPVFLLLAGFGRGNLGTLVNAFALSASSVLAGGPGAAASGTLLGGLLVFFLAADHGVRTLTQYPVDPLPSAGPILGRGAAVGVLIALLLGIFFWQVPPAAYAPLVHSGAIPSVPAGKLVGLLSNVLLVAILSTVAFYLLLRFGGGRTAAGAESVVEIVAARRETARPEGAPYQEPGLPSGEWRARIVALYSKTTGQLAKWGRRRRSFQTPREFSRTLAPAPAAEELADLFGRARYGPEDVTEADFERVSRACREILDHYRGRP